ncbi:MAG: hypothetical protein CUN56_04870 [Phototrophicales bacterium]|nr:MAG: hypothetical protein CUN56_04870 [Phototrophicales bacterium]
MTRLAVTLAAVSFLLIATAIVAFDDLFPGQRAVASLQVGDIAPTNIYAPDTVTYTSAVLTRQREQEARDSVQPIYDPADPAVARQQTELARRILDFILNVRADIYASQDQKIHDIQQITALDLDETTTIQILDVDDETWQDMADEIISLLERVHQDDIRATDLNRIRLRLPSQVSVRFEDDRELDVIVSIVGDLIRPNSSENQELTDAAKNAAAEAVSDATRSFAAGQLVVAEGFEIDEADYEALEALGLLRPSQNRVQNIVQALLGSVITIVVTGMYIARFRPSLFYREPRFLILLAALFLIVLFGARVAAGAQFYIYPTAALALLYVVIIGPEIAFIGTLGLAFLVGLIADTPLNNPLELTALVGVGGLIGSLTLRKAERLNSFFFSGLMVAFANMAVAALFNLNTTADVSEVALLLIYGFLNGILAATVALAGMYVVTLIFNLPTALKLIELSQPNQPLLQRLLREAPGTYQHSLQVANLSEQAATAIGANAELVHVAALYHDIGKMLNPAFFTENQRDIGNPHDTLNDPYRSADIIISHVTEGDEMARQYRLPNRLRDFIREHHGTSEVYVFYKQAVILAGGDESQVDIADFRYPGPKPQSRETAILMLADGCEAAVRSRQPKNKNEIIETVHSVIDGKRKSGQLDESNLTLRDLKIIEDIFIEMFQAIYHPRINYTEAIERVRKGGEPVNHTSASDEVNTVSTKPTMPTVKTNKNHTGTFPTIPPSVDDDDDDSPLAEVPRLRRTDETAQPESEVTDGDS